MANWKKKNGISMISLVITIIVLLILIGVTLRMGGLFIIDKAILASSKTTEALLQEEIELILADIDISYWVEAKDENKLDYSKRKLKEKLEELEHIENVQIAEDDNKNLNIVFSSKDKNYEFQILTNGEVNLRNPLKGNVKLGDYIEYPIEYTDVYSEEFYTASNGWRVIDDGVMEGTSGYVKIISTGIPAKWCCEGVNNRVEVNDLMNHFEDIELRISDGSDIKGSQFKNEKLADRITTLSLSELNHVHNVLYKTKRDLNDESKLEDKYGLFDLNNYYMFCYWLGTIKEETQTGLYFMTDEGIEYYDYEYSQARLGVRPVIYLKSELNGKLENNVWKIID